MQVSLAFFRVFPVSFISDVWNNVSRQSSVGGLFLPSEASRSPGVRQSCLAATDRGALLARGKLCRGPAIAAPWFNRTGDEPAARVVTSARTCSARVSPKLKR